MDKIRHLYPDDVITDHVTPVNYTSRHATVACVVTRARADAEACLFFALRAKLNIANWKTLNQRAFMSRPTLILTTAAKNKTILKQIL